MSHFRIIARPFARNLRAPKADSLGFHRCRHIKRPVWQWNRRAASLREFCASAKEPQTARVSEIVEDIAALTLLESSDLTALLCKKLEENGMSVMGAMMPGMELAAGGGAAGAKADEKPAEKTAFDLKLEAFESAKKVNIIKEVRKFTDLGLKEAKALVEKAPVVFKKGVSKEEAEEIIRKLKENGATASME